jgi:hypothetical protein
MYTYLRPEKTLQTNQNAISPKSQHLSTAYPGIQKHQQGTEKHQPGNRQLEKVYGTEKLANNTNNQSDP